MFQKLQFQQQQFKQKLQKEQQYFMLPILEQVKPSMQVNATTPAQTEVAGALTKMGQMMILRLF